MKIIANDCCGARIYNGVLKENYKTPFIWTRIHNRCFYNLCKQYDLLNFNDFEIIKENDKMLFSMSFNDIKISFEHVIFNPKYNNPTKIPPDIHYNKPWKYIFEKWNERLDRMKNELNEPIFVFHLDENYIKLYRGKEYLYKIIDLFKQNNKKCLVMTDFDDVYLYNLPNNIKYIKIGNPKNVLQWMSDISANKNQEIFKALNDLNEVKI